MSQSPGPKNSIAPALACATSDRATDEGAKERINVRTFRVTISVRGDIDMKQVKWVIKTYSEQNKYVVLERGKNGQKHLHMLIEFAEPKEKRHLRTAIMRTVKKYHPDSKGCALVLRCFIRLL